MILTRRQPTLRTIPPPRRDEAGNGSRHDPTHLGATLRELALKAHRAVRAIDGLGSTAGAGVDCASEHELRELHGRIVQLQRNLHAQSLDGLATYVAALRQEVEDRLS